MVLFHRPSLRNNYVASKVFLYDLATLSLYNTAQDIYQSTTLRVRVRKTIMFD
jgi:hypothetical protein